MNRRQKKKLIKKQNKQLIETYPFLRPRNVWSGRIVNNYDYTYTELDAMPEGWRKSFGLKICEELKEILLKNNSLKEYRIIQIKEKFGTLRWYCNSSDKEIRKVIDKYEKISEHTCIFCGKDNVDIFDDGWISPYCDNCFIRKKERQRLRLQKITKREHPQISKEELLEKYKLK